VSLTPSTTPPVDTQKEDAETLSDIEQAVGSAHIKSETVDAARDEVKRAYSDPSVNSDESLPAIDALNAQQLGGELHPNATTSSPQPSPASDSTTAPPPVPPPIPFQFGNPPPTT
jgi:hypothetical protein